MLSLSKQRHADKTHNETPPRQATWNCRLMLSLGKLVWHHHLSLMPKLGLARGQHCLRSYTQQERVWERAQQPCLAQPECLSPVEWMNTCGLCISTWDVTGNNRNGRTAMQQHGWILNMCQVSEPDPHRALYDPFMVKLKNRQEIITLEDVL